jgi:hypothetical protein
MLKKVIYLLKEEDFGFIRLVVKYKYLIKLQKNNDNILVTGVMK